MATMVMLQSIESSFDFNFTGGITAEQLDIMTHVDNSYFSMQEYYSVYKFRDALLQCEQSGNDANGNAKYKLFSRAVDAFGKEIWRYIEDGEAKYSSNRELYLKIAGSQDEYVPILDMITMDPTIIIQSNPALVNRIAAVSYAISCMQAKHMQFLVKDLDAFNAAMSDACVVTTDINRVKDALTNYDSGRTETSQMCRASLPQSTFMYFHEHGLTSRCLLEGALALGDEDQPGSLRNVLSKYWRNGPTWQEGGEGGAKFNYNLTSDSAKNWVNFLTLLRHYNLFFDSLLYSKDSDGEHGVWPNYEREQLEIIADRYVDAIVAGAAQDNDITDTYDEDSSTVYTSDIYAAAQANVKSAWIASNAGQEKIADLKTLYMNINYDLSNIENGTYSCALDEDGNSYPANLSVDAKLLWDDALETHYEDRETYWPASSSETETTVKNAILHADALNEGIIPDVWEKEYAFEDVEQYITDNTDTLKNNANVQKWIWWQYITPDNLTHNVDHDESHAYAAGQEPGSHSIAGTVDAAGTNHPARNNLQNIYTSFLSDIDSENVTLAQREIRDARDEYVAAQLALAASNYAAGAAGQADIRAKIKEVVKAAAQKDYIPDASNYDMPKIYNTVAVEIRMKALWGFWEDVSEADLNAKKAEIIDEYTASLIDQANAPMENDSDTFITFQEIYAIAMDDANRPQGLLGGANSRDYEWYLKGLITLASGGTWADFESSNELYSLSSSSFKSACKRACEDLIPRQIPLIENTVALKARLECGKNNMSEVAKLYRVLNGDSAYPTLEEMYDESVDEYGTLVPERFIELCDKHLQKNYLSKFKNIPVNSSGTYVGVPSPFDKVYWKNVSGNAAATPILSDATGEWYFDPRIRKDANTLLSNRNGVEINDEPNLDDDVDKASGVLYFDGFHHLTFRPEVAPSGVDFGQICTIYDSDNRSILKVLPAVAVADKAQSDFSVRFFGNTISDSPDTFKASFESMLLRSLRDLVGSDSMTVNYAAVGMTPPGSSLGTAEGTVNLNPQDGKIPEVLKRYFERGNFEFNLRAITNAQGDTRQLKITQMAKDFTDDLGVNCWARTMRDLFPTPAGISVDYWLLPERKEEAYRKDIGLVDDNSATFFGVNRNEMPSDIVGLPMAAGTSTSNIWSSLRLTGNQVSEWRDVFDMYNDRISNAYNECTTLLQTTLKTCQQDVNFATQFVKSIGKMLQGITQNIR